MEARICDCASNGLAPFYLAEGTEASDALPVTDAVCSQRAVPTCIGIGVHIGESRCDFNACAGRPSVETKPHAPVYLGVRSPGLALPRRTVVGGSACTTGNLARGRWHL